jgi:hypothetical protein
MKELKKEALDIEEIMKDIRSRVASGQERNCSEEEILDLLNIDPEDPIDKRAVRGDFWRALHSSRTEEGEVEFVNLSAYLGRGTSLKNKILRKIRKIFWPFARIFFNTGYIFSVQNDSVQLMHNLIYELTLLRLDNDRLRDGYQVLLHKIQQMEAKQRELEKIVSKSRGT